jgi:AraC-like DNA-binding protein
MSDPFQIGELLLRGGTAMLCLFVAFQLVQRRFSHVAAMSGALFGLGAAVYIVASMDVIHTMLGRAHLPVKFIGMIAPGFFWLFVIALLDDRFRLRAPYLAPFAALVLLFPFCCIHEGAIQGVASNIRMIFVLALMGHALYVTRRSLATDLVESRRQLSETLSFVVPLMGATIAAVEIYETVLADAVWTEPIMAIVLFIVTLAFSASILSVNDHLFTAETAATPKSGDAAMTAADRIEIGRLRDLMEESAYLQPGLTIGDLARQVGVPEHRLRRLVNNHLGYRNFSTFINDYRIAEARRRLADPALAREQITGLAFDLGFASLAPFNRAFRERTGMSPSEFREQALASAE